MKKKILTICLATSLAMTLCACNAKVTVGDKEYEFNPTNESVEDTTNPETLNNQTNEDVKNENNSEVIEDTSNLDETEIIEENEAKDEIKENEENPTEKVEENLNKPDTNIVSLQDGKWINFDNMQFAINGNVYTLGKTTLQELIDDGVPFNENDLADANNNIKPNYQSPGYKIILDEYWSAQVYVGNYTENNALAKDLPIVEVYLPNNLDKTQNVLSFAFPLDLTEEQLLEKCGEPDEKKLREPDDEYGYNTYKYIKESDVYYSDSKYYFEFSKKGLKYLYVTYIP